MEGKARHGARDLINLIPVRLRGRFLACSALPAFRTARLALSGLLSWSHACCVHRLNWIGHAPERMASGADPRLFRELAGFAVVGRVGAVRALETTQRAESANRE